MTRALLSLLLALAACDGATSTPPSTPAQPAPVPAPAVDDGSNFASPQQADEPADPQKAAGPPDPALDARVKAKFGDGCRYERACGELVGVDCNAAADGPYYYVDRKELATVSTCGGACRRGCTDCPPKAWTCPTY